LFLGSLRFSDPFFKRLPNTRMNDSLEIAPGGVLFVARPENDLPQRSSVDLPGPVKHTAAETLSDRLLHCLVCQHLVTDFVSIN